MLEHNLIRLDVRLDACQVDDFLDTAVDIRRTTRAYLAATRKAVVAAEQSVYCMAVDDWFFDSARKKVEWTPWYDHLEDAREDVQEATKTVSDFDARLEALDRKAGEQFRKQEEIRQRIAGAVERTSEVLDACEVSGIGGLGAELESPSQEECTSTFGETRWLRREAFNLNNTAPDFQTGCQAQRKRGLFTLTDGFRVAVAFKWSLPASRPRVGLAVALGLALERDPRRSGGSGQLPAW